MIKTNEMNKVVLKPNIKEYHNTLKEHINYVVRNEFKDSKIFSDKNIRLYYYDEYTLNTNVIEDTYATLYVEFESKNNIKQNEQTKPSKRKKIIDLPNYYLDLKDIRTRLYESLINYFDENTLFWLDKYSIRIITNVAISDEETKNYQYRIIPCFSYVNENGIKGIIYYDNNRNEIEVEYPKRSIENFKEKNVETNGAYRDAIVIFKNIYCKSQKIVDYLPSEIFEIILYNVPNHLFKENINQSIFGILNYIRNNSIKNYLTLDEQDNAFTSKLKSMSYLYAKKVISIIEKNI